MEWILGLVGIVVGLAAGVGVGIYIQRTMHQREVGSIEELAKHIREEAKKEAASIRKEAEIEMKDKLFQEKSKQEEDFKKQRTALEELQIKVETRKDTVDQKQAEAEKLEKENHALSKQLDRKAQDLEKKEQDLDALIEEEQNKLEVISGVTKDQAKQMLLDSLEHSVRLDAAKLIKQITDDARENGQRQARQILVDMMQRGCTEIVNETTISTVALPSDDVKGRIIGREGRNIRAFETLTGVNLIIDDTPDTVVLSSFHPIRREASRQTLEMLIQDGRIHPGRIEELFEKVMKDMEEDMREAAERVVYELGIVDMNPELIKNLGRLKYRFSYGQNQLYHARECAFLAGSIASQLGADSDLSKRGALLHDIGKGIDFEQEGTHAALGAELARKLGEKPLIVNAIAAHHEDVEYESLEAVIVVIADSISASRPGARRETLNNYIKRLQQLEGIAESFPGVEKCFAVQAGREVRIIVQPDELDDQAAVKLAYDVSKKIEEEMQYPGQIKINVIRETRAVSYAR